MTNVGPERQALPPLTILLAAPRGFCAGVDRAIRIVELALKKFGPPVYVRHEIVHNRHVVDDLKAKGAIFVEELDEIPETTAPVIFSAHGVAQSVPAAAKARNLFCLDAICPLVSKVHIEARAQHAKGLEIVLIGHAGHPEVVGTLGQLPANAATLIETLEDARRFQPRDPARLAYITQTTLSVDDTAAIVAVLRERFPAVRRPAQGRYLLRHDQPPGRRQGDRRSLRRPDRHRLAQQLQLAAAGRGRPARRLPPGAALAVRQRPCLERFCGCEDARSDRRRLGAGAARQPRSSMPSARILTSWWKMW